MPVTTPGWVPPGQEADESRYRYDFKTGWVPPGDKSTPSRSQVVMPPGFDPKQDEGFEVVVSPPGQRAPEGISYTPSTDEIHGLGEQPPIQRTNYTIVPAAKPGSELPPGTPSAFPKPDLPMPPMGGPPPGGPPPMPGPMGPRGMPPPMPPLNLGGGATPPPPGMGGGPSPMGGLPPPPPLSMSPNPGGMGAGPPVGGGQDTGFGMGAIARRMFALIGPDVGVGEDVGVGASSQPPSNPAYVGGISQNQLPLSPGEAATACGPAAALFATRMGRQPTAEEARDLRQKAIDAGWSPGGGMTTGPDGFIRLARSLGVTMERGPADPNRIRDDAVNGLPVVISTPQGRTPGHYWQISDYDAASGKFVMGDAVGARAPGSLMSLQDIQNHPGYGGPPTVLYVAGESRQTDRVPSARATGGAYRTLSAQNQGGGGGFSQWDDLIRRHAPAHLRDDRDFLYAVNVGIHGESGGDPNRQERGGPAVGLYQIQDPVSFDRTDPEASTRYMMPRYVEAWRRANAEHPDWSLQDRAILTSAYAERPRGVTRGPGGADQFDMNSTAAANYRRAAQALPGGGSTSIAQRVGQIPGNILQGVQDLVSGFLGATTPTAYAAEDGSYDPMAETRAREEQLARDRNAALQQGVSAAWQGVGNLLSTPAMTTSGQRAGSGITPIPNAPTTPDPTAVQPIPNATGAPGSQGRSALDPLTRPSLPAAPLPTLPGPGAPPLPASTPATAAPNTPFNRAIEQARRAAASRGQPAVTTGASPNTPSNGPAWGNTPGPVGPQPDGTTAPAQAAPTTGGYTDLPPPEEALPDVASIPEHKNMPPALQAATTRRAQVIQAQNPGADPARVMERAAQEVYGGYINQPVRPAQPNAGASMGRVTEQNSPTPKMEELSDDQLKRVEAQRAQMSRFGMAPSERTLIRDALGLAPLGSAEPGDPLVFAGPNGEHIIYGIYGDDGKPHQYPSQMISYLMNQAGMGKQSPITVTAGGYSYHLPAGSQGPNDVLVGTPDGGLARINAETGEQSVLRAGEPGASVHFAPNASRTGTDVIVYDKQGNILRVDSRTDDLAMALRTAPTSTTNVQGGVIRTTYRDPVTGRTTTSENVSQIPQISVRGSGSQTGVTQQRWDDENKRWIVDTQYSEAPIGMRDVYSHGIHHDSTGSYVIIPGGTDENGTPQPMRRVLIQGSQGVPHFDTRGGGIYSTTGGQVEQIGEMQQRRRWRQIRDPFGGIAMVDDATGDFVPVRQAAPKIVNAGDRYIMLTPPRLTAMKGVGNRVDNLSQLPWQTTQMSPRAAALYQELVRRGAGAAQTDVPPGSAASAPSQEPTPQNWDVGPAQSAPQFGNVPLAVEDDGDAVEGGMSDLGDYTVQPPSQSQFGLPDSMRLPSPQDEGDYTDTMDQSTVGYDDEDSDYSAYDEGDYGDEEDQMDRRRRRVGAGQGYGDLSGLSDDELIQQLRSELGGSRNQGTYGGVEMPNPYGSPSDWGASVVGMRPQAKKGYSSIKGDDGRIYSFNEDTGELANVAPGSGLQEREFGLKERQMAQSEAQSAEANAIKREELGIRREELGIQADPRKFRLQPHMIDLGRGGTAVYDPETGMVQQVSPREPQDVRAVGRDIYVPAGRTLDVRYGLPGDPGYGATTRFNGGDYSGWVPTRNTPALPFGASGGPAGGYQGGGGYSAGNAPVGGYGGGAGGGSYGGSAGYGRMGGMGGGGYSGGMGGYSGGGGGYPGGNPYSGFSAPSPPQGPPQGWQPPPGAVIPAPEEDPSQGRQMPMPPGWLDMGAVEQSFRPTGWQGPWQQGLGALW